MTTVDTELIPQSRHPQYRLGRHVEHDPRSWEHDAAHLVPRTVQVRTVEWKRHSPILNQGDLGSCTGNAMAGWLACEPGCTSDAEGSVYTEDFARKLYSIATKVDAFPGEWPPDDTGSSGLAVAKAARGLGLIRRYSWAFTTDGLIRALMLGPVIVGVPWYESMFNPDSNGYVSATVDSGLAGGHEFLIRGYDVIMHRFLADNSWGDGWGAGGSFKFTRSTWDILRGQRADVTVPHV